MVFNLSKKATQLESDTIYKKLLAEIPDLIFQFIVTPSDDYFFPIISDSIFEIFELTPEDLNRDSMNAVYDRILDKDRDLFLESYTLARANLERWELEFRIFVPIKGERWLKVSSKSELQSDGAITFYGRISDITDKKEQDLRLKISEARFQFALEASTAGVWDWDLKSNDVFYSSQSMKILEVDAMDVFDTPERWDEMVHSDDLENYYSDIQNHFQNKIPYYENQHRVLTSKGEYKWILDRGKVIERDELGNPLRVIGTHTDISAQKQKELELQKTMELYAEQNSRLLNFSYIVSHNLNTHAGNIKSILDYIDKEETFDGKEEMLAHLRTVSNDLNRTIRNLTKIVAIQNNETIFKEPLQLQYYIDKIAAIININDEKIKIINTVSDLVFVNFNPAYLESILLNFITNAIKYAHPDRFPSIEFRFETSKFVLAISDNGLGIDLDKYGDQLFGMYKTFHKNEDAQGIGLYITKNQIEAMNASIDVTSEIAAGTTFEIFFDNK
ncbi:sensor histidine kinase [Flavobacterium restrictum]|uniref:histidine kinase n=1 Tax=Flavobacterium restrictum TaxID=2594428 RepID=A0A553E3Y2_9FLAO|nr:PAS domain-containing sensor histidine kinase [Flavobacterium restrictum]TRX39705.1 PAS domain-containing sensor histidine kinase [Flavobacterium restrictum]